MTESKTLGELFPIEQARVRSLQQEYQKIGPAGAIGHALLEQVLRRAEAAAISGDVVSMLKSYEEMKECQ